MKLEFVLVGLLLIISVLNLIIYKKKTNLIKMIIGVFVCLLYLGFVFYEPIKEYIWIYEIFVLVIILIFSLLFIPKKITKNITEYDFFELEKSYNDLKEDREKLRQRYLSTVALIDEGVVFYENGCQDIILSDYAHDVFGGKQSRSFNEHLESISVTDRDEYKRTIDRVSKKQMTYDIKYRINKNGNLSWVHERGHFIGVESKRSIIGIVSPLDIKCFKNTSYFEVDSMYQEDKMYTLLRQMIENKKPFSFITFELSNIKDINHKYGREIGSLMMNEYIKMLKNNYQQDINKMFRITGIRYAMIMDDYKCYEDFHNALTSSNSDINGYKIQIASVKDSVNANFGVVNITGMKKIEVEELVNFSQKLLDEAISSTRKNYSIFGE